MIENFENVEIIGLAATFIGVLGFFPIVKKVWKTGYTKNFPYLAIFLALTSYALWVLYGVLVKSWSLIISCSILFGIYLYILFVKMKN